MRRWAVGALVGLAVLAALGSTASGRSRYSPISWSFQGYANNVRVRPPLVAAFQLGKVFAHGSGDIAANGGLAGALSFRTDPRDASIPARSIVMKTVGYSFYQAAHAVWSKLTLQVEITAANAPGECAVGTRGKLTLYDSKQTISNGQPSDYITLGEWNAKCATFIMGFTNEDTDRTSPRSGGPPHGGQFAIVHINLLTSG